MHWKQQEKSCRKGSRKYYELAKFIRNLESTIYAQFAKQLVESMFSNDNPTGFGSFILEGNTITWEVITRRVRNGIHPFDHCSRRR